MQEMDFTPFLHYISEYGYPALFMLILLGGVYVPIPTGILLVAVGAIARQGYIDPFIAFGVTLLASVVADFLVYSIARRFGRNEKLKAFFSRSRFGKSIQHYLDTYPKMTIVVTRIIGVITTPTNALAGLSRMKLVELVPADIAGNVIADGVYLGAGFFLGGAFASNPHAAELSIGIVLAILIVIGLASYFIFRPKKS